MELDQREDRRRRYLETLRLWESENPIKTTKLQYLLLTNALLVPAFLALERWAGGGRAAVVAAAAAGADLVWLLSIGRTVGYQKLRKRELARLQEEDPGDPLLSLHAPPKAGLPWYASASASSYLIGAPIGLGLLWAALLVWALASRG